MAAPGASAFLEVAPCSAMSTSWTKVTTGDLYARTGSFKFYATPVYTAFYFYDSKDHLLGHFQAGSVSTVTSGGGGAGGWS